MNCLAYITTNLGLLLLVNVLIFSKIVHCVDTGLPKLDGSIVNELEELRDVVEAAMDYNINGEGKGAAWNKLKDLVDLFGARFAGTESLESAIDYMGDLLREEFDDTDIYQIRTEQVDHIVNWTRITEEATLNEPTIKLGDGSELTRNIAVLGSGYSPSTPDDGITAEVVVVRNYDELDALGQDGVAGKIVVYNQPWGDGYGDGSTYRFNGPSRASEYGAAASLTRSLGDLSFYTPHTGSTYFEENVDPIPCGCITVEDAEKLQRLYDEGNTLSMTLKLIYERTDENTSFNLIVDVLGRELPDERVIFGGHSDSWDVGEGAMDDGGGIMITWQVLSTLKAINFRPRRTLSLVFWTAEEVEGNPGATQYFEQHYNVSDVYMVMESDSGTFKPLGLEYSGAGLGKAITEYMLSMLEPIGATEVVEPASGVDIRPWLEAGVSGFSLHNQNDAYFWYHHTEGDTILLQEPDNLDGCTVTWFVGALIAAEYSDREVWYEGDHPGYHPLGNTAATFMYNNLYCMTVGLLFSLLSILTR